MQNKRRLSPILLGAALFAALMTYGCTASEDDIQKPVIKLHDPQSASLWVNNALAEVIIENGYGHPVETVVETTPVMQETLPKGEIDLNMEGWQ